LSGEKPEKEKSSKDASSREAGGREVFKKNRQEEKLKLKKGIRRSNPDG